MGSRGKAPCLVSLPNELRAGVFPQPAKACPTVSRSAPQALGARHAARAPNLDASKKLVNQGRHHLMLPYRGERQIFGPGHRHRGAVGAVDGKGARSIDHHRLHVSQGERRPMRQVARPTYAVCQTAPSGERWGYPTTPGLHPCHACSWRIKPLCRRPCFTSLQ